MISLLSSASVVTIICTIVIVFAKLCYQVSCHIICMILLIQLTYSGKFFLYCITKPELFMVIHFNAVNVA